MNRIILILTILGLYTSVLGGEKQSTTPNILFIMADDLG